MAHSLNVHVTPCAHSHHPVAQHHEDETHATHEHHHAHRWEAHRPRQRRALFLCVLLTGLMMIVEFVAGLWTGSLMLISDSIHMLSHTTALGVSFLAIIFARKEVGSQFPFGLYRIEILAALFNGISLAGFCLWIVYEAILRMVTPVAIMGPELTTVALIGLAVNLTTAVILRRAGLEDLNTKSAFLHMLADTFSSFAIVTGGLVISLTGWVMVDPLLSVVVAVLVGRWSWGLLRDSTLVLLERKPDHINPAEIEQHVRERFPEVRNVHDLHIWEITSQFVCLSAHIVVEDIKLSETEQIRSNIGKYLMHHFGIGHVVLQVEC